MVARGCFKVHGTFLGNCANAQMRCSCSESSWLSRSSSFLLMSCFWRLPRSLLPKPTNEVKFTFLTSMFCTESILNMRLLSSIIILSILMCENICNHSAVPTLLTSASSYSFVYRTLLTSDPYNILLLRSYKILSCPSYKIMSCRSYMSRRSSNILFATSDSHRCQRNNCSVIFVASDSYTCQ